tara:strand:- start:2124 stop:2783 length:660 start_codon:yes stop_codon:yes gene_type:complete
METKHQKLFRDENGDIKDLLSSIEGFSFREDPLSFFITAARYKFATRFIKKEHKVLDAGCGHGFGSIFLSKFSKSVIGGDYDEELVSHNNKEFLSIDSLEFKQLNLLDISKEHEEQYDVVVSMDVIEHFEKSDIDLVANNYSKLLKPGGFAVIGTPNIASQKFASQRRINSHPFEFDYDEFDNVLNKAFRNVFVFSMTDEIVSTQFPKMAWYLMAICTK